jgi:D-galactarolactone cycloisomerase
MKITGIRTHILQSALSQPFAFSQGWVAQRSATLVEVTTDTGTSGWGSAIAQAASLQVIAALSATHHSLFAREPILEYDRSSHPFRRELITQPIELHDGMVKIPDGPGLGIEVVAETLDRYRVN